MLKNATCRWQPAHLVIHMCDKHYFRYEPEVEQVQTLWLYLLRYESLSSLNFGLVVDRRQAECDAYEPIVEVAKVG